MVFRLSARKFHSVAAGSSPEVITAREFLGEGARHGVKFLGGSLKTMLAAIVDG